MKVYEGVDTWRHAFLTGELDGGERSARIPPLSGKVIRWIPEPVWTIWLKKKIPCPRREKRPDAVVNQSLAWSKY
jgi:hypothetical protein